MAPNRKAEDGAGPEPPEIRISSAIRENTGVVPLLCEQCNITVDVNSPHTDHRAAARWHFRPDVIRYAYISLASTTKINVAIAAASRIMERSAPSLNA